MSDNAENLTNTWNYPTTVHFGIGAISRLAEACRDAGMKRPLLVTDPGVAELPMIREAVAALEAEDMATVVFKDVRPNPLDSNIEDGTKAFSDGGHDGVIALGGGSGLDAGKAIAFMVAQDLPIWDFEDIGDNWKAANVEGIAPIVAVPTTAGTGSEVGRAAVIANATTGIKKIIFHPRMMPVSVIADPALTVGLPPKLTAATGMDAFTHCLEAYLAPVYHPMADGVAVEGMRLIKQWLPVATSEGGNLEARSHMMAAASMGATAFQKGLGAIHSLSHPVGSLYGVHHGLANAVFTPYVLAFNRPAIAEKTERLARYLDLPEASFQGLLDWVLELRRELGIPHGARDLGIEEDRLDELSEMAALDPTAPTNPVKAGPVEMRKMYEAALAGTVGN